MTARSATGVLEVAQREHARPPGDTRQEPRRRPGRDHETVELQPAAVCQRDRRDARSRCSAVDPSSSSIPSASSCVRGLERAPIDVPCTREELLGEWRTIVWKVLLVADQGHTTLEAVLAEGLAGT